MPKTGDQPSGLDNLLVRRERLSEQVADQIQQLIIQGGLKPGDRLPPERELAERLGVSRTVVREATKALQERGLIKVITGSGTYATRVEPALVSQSIGLYVRGHRHDFRDLLEIRALLEVEVAGLAAERATGQDIEQIASALGKMAAVLPGVHKSTASLEEFVQADLLFHQHLANASKNALLPVLLAPITDLLLEFRRKASSFAGAPDSAVNYHRTILECVRQRDGRGCREAMRAHISKTEDFLRLMEQDEGAPTP